MIRRVKHYKALKGKALIHGGEGFTFECPICQKSFFTFVPTEWAYKATIGSKKRIMVCSYSCCNILHDIKAKIKMSTRERRQGYYD